MSPTSYLAAPPRVNFPPSGRGGTRTLTPFRATDFKSGVSTHSTTRPKEALISIKVPRKRVKNIFRTASKRKEENPFTSTNVEVNGIGMVKHERRNARFGFHHERLREGHADVFGMEKPPHDFLS